MSVRFFAGRDLTIAAATEETHSESSSIGASATLSGSTVSASFNTSSSESGSRTHLNAAVTAGGSMTLDSGRDTLIDGAHIEADRIEMQIGRDLTVRSRQNESWSESSSFNIAGSFDFATYTPSLDSLGLSGGSSERRWTDAMTLILARDSLKAEVEGHTQLTGAAIASETGDLAFSTGTFGWEDLQDYDRSESWGVDISGIGLSWTPGKGVQGNSGIASLFADAEQAGRDSAKSTTGSAFLGEAGFTYSGTDRQGLTHATLGAGTIEVRDTPNQQLASLNRNLATAQEITRDESTEIGINAVFLDLGRLGRQLDNIGNVANAMTTEIPPEFQSIEDPAKAKAYAEAFRLAVASGKSEQEAKDYVDSDEMRFVLNRGIEANKAIAFYGSESRIPPKVAELIAAGFSLAYGEASLWDGPAIKLPGCESGSSCMIPVEHVKVTQALMLAEGRSLIESASRKLGEGDRTRADAVAMTELMEGYECVILSGNMKEISSLYQSNPQTFRIMARQVGLDPTTLEIGIALWSLPTAKQYFTSDRGEAKEYFAMMEALRNSADYFKEKGTVSEGAT